MLDVDKVKRRLGATERTAKQPPLLITLEKGGDITFFGVFFCFVTLAQHLMSSFQKMLSVAMEERTRAAHERLIHHPFEKAISSGQFNREQYVQYLSDFHAIFSAIESRVQAWPREMSGVWDARLARTSNIAKDLEYFDATPSRPAPSASAAKYAMYIQSLSAEQLHLLIAHIWCDS